MAYVQCASCNVFTHLGAGNPNVRWICSTCTLVQRIERLETKVAALEAKATTAEKLE